MTTYWLYQIRRESYKLRNFPLWSWLPRLFIIFVILLLLYIVIANFSSKMYPLQVPVSSHFPTEIQVDRCVEFNLFATRNSGGMGNVVFELMFMLGIAIDSNRKPHISDYYANAGAMIVLERFPALKQYIKRMQRGAHCLTPTENFQLMTQCCTYSNITDNLLTSKNISIKVDAAYVQSFKYFTSLQMVVPKLLHSTEEVRSIAKHNLFPGVLNHTSPKICVHIRRGDFLKVKNVVASHMNFTRASIDFVRSNQSYPVYITSNDQKWSKQALAGISNIYFAETKKDWPPNVEWEFSRLFCDKIILTASASTYGWWMAFLSKGQDVYYNAKFSTPDGIEKELKTSDFFLPHWKPIDLTQLGRISQTQSVNNK